MLDDLTIEQRLALSDKANEVLGSGWPAAIAQKMTANYISKLKNLPPHDSVGRDHLISRLCVLGDVMEAIVGKFQHRSGDGDVALQEMKVNDE